MAHVVRIPVSVPKVQKLPKTPSSPEGTHWAASRLRMYGLPPTYYDEIAA